MKLCMNRNFVRIKNVWKEQLCKLKVWDFCYGFPGPKTFREVRLKRAPGVDNSEFKKRLRVRQRVRYKTTGFNEQTNGLHVRYNFWYISLPYSAKQQREMTKFRFCGVRGTHDGEFLISLSELECRSYQICSKIVQTHSTSLTSGTNCDAI